jgi:hypothetical protein
MVLVKPATVIQWHRQGFRLYWRWRARRLGRPKMSAEIRDLIRKMSLANRLWGAPRIHGELLKLGIKVSQATVGRYMPWRPKVPSPTWRSFLHNHLTDIAAIDMFVVATATFRLLYTLIVLSLDRRRFIHFGVTEGQEFRNRVQAMGIKQVVTAPQSPWQNPYVERLIGSIRCECLDHTIIFNESHLRRVLSSYFQYHHGARTHLSLNKDCPRLAAYSHPLQARSSRSPRWAVCIIATNEWKGAPGPGNENAIIAGDPAKELARCNRAVGRRSTAPRAATLSPP